MFFPERVQGGAWVLPRTAACNIPYSKRNGDVPIQNFFRKINNELQIFNSPKPCYILLHKLFSFWSPRVSEVFVGLADELPKCARDASKDSVNNVLRGILCN